MADNETAAGSGAPADQGSAAPAPAPTAQTQATQVSPPAPAQPTTPPAAPPPAPAAAPANVQEQDPAWFSSRIERAKKAGETEALKRLGVENWDQAQAAIEKARAEEEAKKSAEQRALEAATQAKTFQSTAERQASLLKEQASRMMMALSEDQAKAVTEFAGDDPELQLRAIHHFGPTWAKAMEAERQLKAAEASKVEAAKTEAAKTQPANTSPAPGAPPGSDPGSPPNPTQLYQSARSRNPFAAAAYGLANPSVYERK